MKTTTSGTIDPALGEKIYERKGSRTRAIEKVKKGGWSMKTLQYVQSQRRTIS